MVRQRQERARLYGACAVLYFVLRHAGYLIHDLAALPQVLHIDPLHFEVEVELDLATDQYIYFVVVLPLGENLVPSLHRLRLNMKDQLLVRLYAQLPKILNVEQDVLLPAPVLVLVLNHVLPHGLLQVGENQDYFVEGFFRDMSNITVVLRLDIGCAPVLRLN